MRPGLFPKTRTDPGIAQWQVRLIDNIVIVKREESMFGSRDQVEIFTLDLVDHVFKVCERNGPRDNVAPEKVRRLIELEAFFHDKIQSILDECMVQPDKILSQVIEPRSGDATCFLDIDEPAFESQVDMVKGLEVELPNRAPFSYFDIVVFI